MKKWLLGMYRRRSFDERNDGESNSVINQKKLIENYLVDKDDIMIYKCYVDDGYTGTDFNRPGYKEMLNDIKNGRINGVIVKDLSRLGRNYIEVGNFIEKIIPQFGLRFISINDNVDSYKNSNIMDSLEIPFKNLINESYSKDTSKKMRTALLSSKKTGNFIGKVAPFGFIKDSKDKHNLLIDLEAAKIIDKIFDLAFKGNSRQEIKGYLNSHHIATPSMYLKEKYNIKLTKIAEEWSVNMVDHILKNMDYKGLIVQYKRTRINHKIHNIVRVAEDDWIITKSNHKPIIKEEIFDQVQDIFYNRNVKVNKNGKFYKYSGFLKCSECGNNLYRMTRKKKGKEQVFYYCSTYIRTKKCNKHYIMERDIDESLLCLLNNFVEMICDVSKKIDNIVSTSKIEYNIETKKLQLVEVEKGIQKYKKLIDEVVKDYQCDFISQEDYEEFKRKYLYEINKLNMEKENLKRTRINSYNLDWLNKFRKLQKFDSIDRNIVDIFIENIFVDNNKNLDVKFRFNDQYKIAIEYLKNQKNML